MTDDRRKELETSLYAVNYLFKKHLDVMDEYLEVVVPESMTNEEIGKAKLMLGNTDKSLKRFCLYMHEIGKRLVEDKQRLVSVPRDKRIVIANG